MAAPVTRPARKPKPAPIEAEHLEPPAPSADRELELATLPAPAQAMAERLASIAAGRSASPIESRGAIDGGKYQNGSSQVVATDPDAEAVAIRERLVRHSLDAMAGTLLPKALRAIGLVLDGEHPAGPKGGAAVIAGARIVTDSLRMTGAHILDRDRTRGADALTVGELEAEISRTQAALRRKLEAERVVSTVPATDRPANTEAPHGQSTA